VPNVDKALERLQKDHALWARKCAKILTKRKQLVALELRPWQHKLQDKLAEQRLAEKPERAIILKARQLGFSTDVQAMFMQRCTLIPYQAALTVAHDLDTAGKLFDIGHRIYHNLPEDPRLKPQLTHERDSKGGMKYMQWANGSTYDVETAGDIRGGRGQTPFLLHLSEIAHYLRLEGLDGLLNGVPDEPGSCVIWESTANGRNHFERQWLEAVQGINGYAPIFVPWQEDPDYSLEFDSIEAREEFEASIGEGEIGEDEPMLQERFDLTLEQLNWRRFTIRAKLRGDVEKFKQEYPAYPEEAFLATGHHVFAVAYTSRVLGRIEERRKRVELGEIPAPKVGILQETATETKRTREGTVEVPTRVQFVPVEATGFNRFVHPMWVIYEDPIDPGSSDHLPREEQPLFRPGQYVAGVDVSGDETVTTTGDTAWDAIQIIEHASQRQVARWRGRVDSHQLLHQAMLGAVYFNRAVLAPEITGGYGGPIATGAWRRYGYPNVYRRTAIDGQNEKTQDLYGWDTNTKTRPELIAWLEQQLAESTDGIVDDLTADELTSFIYNERGKPVPDVDHFSDLIMALMIAKMVARIRRPRINRSAPRPKKPVRGSRKTPRYG
jgi:hypothetical protein